MNFDFGNMFFGEVHSDLEMAVERRLQRGEYVEEIFIAMSDDFFGEHVEGTLSRNAIMNFLRTNVFTGISMCVVRNSRTNGPIDSVAIVRAIDPHHHPRVISILRQWPYYFHVGFRIKTGAYAMNAPLSRFQNPWGAQNGDQGNANDQKDNQDNANYQDQANDQFLFDQVENSEF